MALKQAKIEAGSGAKAQGQSLQPELSGSKRFAFCNGQGSVSQFSTIPFHRSKVPPAPAARQGMGAGAQSQVGDMLPVSCCCGGKRTVGPRAKLDTS